ncbi:MAG: methyltransferase domain-containing protein [Candidatus Atribacteria bacterium]|nr:methyltransferase domain-containing protein [Candidatus Atribacteria bacterium]
MLKQTSLQISEEEWLLEDRFLLLFDNVQFIYELALAQLELRALKVNFEVTNGLRKFKVVEDPKDIDVLKRRLAYFKLVGKEYTHYFHIVGYNRTRSVNQYLTHWIYPYKGKFHPQMIRALLNIMGMDRGNVVLDPFVGSGTAALEAQLLGIDFIGVDISPLCVLQSRVKTESVAALPEILRWKDEVAAKIGVNLFNPDEKAFERTLERIPDERVRNFYLMAKLVAVSDRVRRKKDFTKAFQKNLDLMILSVRDYNDVVQELDLKLGNVDIRRGDARNLPLADESIDGIVTSPPYSIALDYVANDAHALEMLGYDLKKLREEFTGVRGKGQRRIDLYNEDMKRSLEEMYRVLKPGRFAVIIIGNAMYQGQEVETVRFITEQGERIGFQVVQNMEKIIFGLYNVMQKENIVVLQKADNLCDRSKIFSPWSIS